MGLIKKRLKFEQLRHYGLVYLFAHNGIVFPSLQGVHVNSQFKKKMKLKGGNVFKKTRKMFLTSRLMGLMEKRKF